MTNPSPPIALDAVPHEVLEQIAYFAATDTILGPPSTLPALLSANRTLHASLSLPSNPHLYARIFAAKFDAAAPIRRLGANELTVMALATELKRRCTVLKCIRARLDSLVVHPPAAPREEDMLDTVLWTAYLMMLENDGKNEAQLREYAQLDGWLQAYWFHPDGASHANLAIEAGRWPPNSDQTALAMWLFWLLLKPDTYLQDEELFRTAVCILKPLALGAHKYSLSRTPWTEFHPPAPRAAGAGPVAHFCEARALAPVPLAVPAILAYLSLANRQLPRDMVRVAPLAPAGALGGAGRLSLSEKWDTEWRRCAAQGEGAPAGALPARAYKPGSIEGVWEGMFTYTEFTAYAALLSGAGPQILQKSLVAQHRQTWKLREHHLLAAAPGPRAPGADAPDAGPAPLAPGDALRAHVPPGAGLREGSAGLAVADAPGAAPLLYTRFSAEGVRAHERASAEGGVEYAARVRDILITGEGHSAWGQFRLTGRVRPADGFVTISKDYLDGDRGKWLYHGYLVGVADGNLVGRWRDTLSPPEVHGYEGCYGMSRRR